MSKKKKRKNKMRNSSSSKTIFHIPAHSVPEEEQLEKQGATKTIKEESPEIEGLVISQDLDTLGQSQGRLHLEASLKNKQCMP
ncbi:MAG: hypothetical protein AAGJ35_09370, partial [Myxococcota bacterium]